MNTLPRCPYCGGPLVQTEHQLFFVVNGYREPDGFRCIAKPRCPGLYPVPERPKPLETLK